TSYTRACRLKKIIDVFGQYAEFKYRERDPREIQYPIEAPGSTNAYQFQYETKLLDRVEVYTPAGVLLSVTRLTFRSINVATGENGESDHYLKPYLIGIQQEYPNAPPLPGFTFDYYESPDDVNPGALKTVTYPEGAIA